MTCPSSVWLLRTLQIDSGKDIQWLDSPPEAAVESAELLLGRLGASGNMAQQLIRFPLAPRLSRLLVEAVDRGVGEDGCVAAALLASGFDFGTNDLLTGMDQRADPRLLQPLEQLRKIARPSRRKHHDEDALLKSVLVGFSDRVARLQTGNRVMLSTGATAEVKGHPPPYEFMVALDAEDRRDKPLPLVRMTARIEPEWLIDLFPDRVREQSTVLWNRATERVDAVSMLLYDELIIQESRGAVPEPQAAADLLAQKALEAGIERFVDRDKLDQFLSRIDFSGFEPPDIQQALRELCLGLLSFARTENRSTKFHSDAGAASRCKATESDCARVSSIAKRAANEDSL